MKNLSVYFLPIFILCSCANHGQLTYIVKLPKDLKENSGLVTYRENTAWSIEDSGNSDNIYKINFDGEVIKTLEVKNAKNKDWEDLTKDDYGNLYIGDFGNNENKRKDLTVYKLPNPETEPGDKIEAEKIKFSYPEQKDFPPKKIKGSSTPKLFSTTTVISIFSQRIGPIPLLEKLRCIRYPIKKEIIKLNLSES